MFSGLYHKLAHGYPIVPTLLCTGLLIMIWHLMAPRLVVLVAQAAASQGEDIATFMIRNAYHFSTLYHAARAEQWELAAYEAEELAETLEDAERASPTYTPLLQQYRQEFVSPLHQAPAAGCDTISHCLWCGGAGLQQLPYGHSASVHHYSPRASPLLIFVLPFVGR